MFWFTPITESHFHKHASKIHQSHAIETFFFSLSTNGQDSISSLPNKLSSQDRPVDSTP